MKFPPAALPASAVVSAKDLTNAPVVSVIIVAVSFDISPTKSKKSTTSFITPPSRAATTVSAPDIIVFAPFQTNAMMFPIRRKPT